MTTFNSKLILRNDTLTNWNTHDPVLLKGEIGIGFDATTGESFIKIGDGVKTWSGLEYFVIPKISSLETLVGKLPSGTTATSIVDYINKKTEGIATDGAIAELQAILNEHESSLAILEGGKEVAGSVAAIAAAAVAEIVAGADTSFDTLKEIADWIKNDTTGAAKMAADIDALEALVGNKAVATQISEAIAAALKVEGADKYALASNLEALAGRVGTAEGKISSAEGRIKNLEDIGAQANVIETIKVNGSALIPSSKAVNISVPTGTLASKDKVAVADLASELASKITTLEGASHSHTNKTELDKIASGDVAKWNAAEQNAKNYADGLAKNYAAAVHNHEISEVNGLQNALNAKVNDDDLKAVAKSGNIKDLIQTTGDYVIFNCGSANTVI